MRLRPGDPPAATLGFVAAVALIETVILVMGQGAAQLKWPNDVLIGRAKLSGVLLERADDAVVVGIGVNLAHHPDLPERPATSLAAQGVSIAPALFAERLAESFALWLGRWRGEGFAPVRAHWLQLAHPLGSALTVRLPSGERLDGVFEGLDADGALVLRTSTARGGALAAGERRVIHAADVFLV